MSRTERTRRYEGIAVRLVTRQGYPLAAGGICLAGCGGIWRRRFARLSELSIEDHSLYGIDYALAAALEELGDETLVLAGAAVDTGDKFEEWERTGGVLGSPLEKIRSVAGSCDKLPGEFHLWAAPGGPGLAINGGEDCLRRVLERTGLLENGPAEPLQVYQTLKEEGIETGMLVLDGTGRNAHGLLMAFAGEGMEYKTLENTALI